MAHLYGLLGLERDPEAAAAWFKASRLPASSAFLRPARMQSGHPRPGSVLSEAPLAWTTTPQEGFMAVAAFHEARGTPSERWRARALRLGFGSPWRQKARDQGGFALHNVWPELAARNLPQPPKW